MFPTLCSIPAFQQHVGCVLGMNRANQVKVWGEEVPGASMRNSAHGKGHEEGGVAYAKAGLSLRKPPVPKHLPTKPVCLLYCFMLSPIPLTYGELSPTASLGEGVNLQLQLIKIPGHDKGVSGQTSLLAN